METVFHFISRLDDTRVRVVRSCEEAKPPCTNNSIHMHKKLYTFRRVMSIQMLINDTSITRTTNCIRVGALFGK